MGAVRVSFIMATRKFDAPNIARVERMLPAGTELVVCTVPGGAAHARNVGARRASGEVFVFMDDDVLLDASWAWEDWIKGDWDFAIAEWYSPSSKVNTPWMRLACAALNTLTRVFHYPLTMTGFTAMRRHVFYMVGGYRVDTTYEEPAMTLALHGRGFKGRRLPVRVTMLQSWDSFGRYFDATSRGKEHPEPKPGEVVVLRIP